MMPRGPELIIIFLVILLLFGATRLPQLGSSLGSAIRNFKKGFGGDAEPEPDAEKKAGGTLSASSETEAPAKEPAKSAASRDA